MSWSPDYELMVLVTGNNTLVSMTQEWDIVTEVSIDSQQKEPKQGWKGFLCFDFYFSRHIYAYFVGRRIF